MFDQFGLHRFNHFRIELRQNVVSKLNDGGVDAAMLQILGEFNADETRTNNHCRLDLFGVNELFDCNRIRNITQNMCAFETRNRHHARLRTGRQNQRIVVLDVSLTGL